MSDEEQFVVLTENDVSQWDDKTGERYHFPKQYNKSIKPGMQFVYYKGRLKPENKAFEGQRLSKNPHYFGIGRIVDVQPDKAGHLIATLSDFQAFEEAVLAKNDDNYLEEIPESKKSNYWRVSVRKISRSVFDNIVLNAITSAPLSLSDAVPKQNEIENEKDEESLFSYEEGKKSSKFVTVYERNPKLKQQAKALHGTTCFGCGFNFGEFYGEYGQDFIHIHHVVPVSLFGKSKRVDPKTDLIPVCANCHSIIHRKKDRTLSIEELKTMIAINNKKVI